MTTPSQHDDRNALARRQAALMSALQNTAPPPDGFNPAHLQTAADSLARKRSHSVRKTWSATAAALGDCFDSHFSSYCAKHPSPPESPHEDGFQFARWLEKSRLLPSQARLELTRHRVGRDGVPRLHYADRALTLLFRAGKSVRTFRIRIWPA